MVNDVMGVAAKVADVRVVAVTARAARVPVPAALALTARVVAIAVTRAVVPMAAETQRVREMATATLYAAMRRVHARHQVRTRGTVRVAWADPSVVLDLNAERDQVAAIARRVRA